MDGMIESCEWGFFWNLLRKNRFMLDDAKSKVQDRIDEAMSRPIRELPTGQITCMIDECDYEPHEIAHLGCGHYCCRWCYQNYIEELITRGPVCIEFKCPYHDLQNPKKNCQYQITHALV